MPDSPDANRTSRARRPAPPRVVVYRVDTDPDAALGRDPELALSPEEKTRAGGFRFEADRRRYVIMHAALRRVLSRHLDTAPQALTFRENDFAKPLVPGGPEFNISYSGDVGLIAVSMVPVGVDIEEADPAKLSDGMVEEVFSVAERDSYFSGAFADHADAFFRGWVRKESVVKAMGRGVSFPLQQVESRLDLGAFAATYEGVEYWTGDLEGYGPRHRAALTTAGGASPVVDLEAAP